MPKLWSSSSLPLLKLPTELRLILGENEQGRDGGGEASFHVLGAPAKDLSFFLDRIEWKAHPFHADGIQMTIQQNPRSGFGPANCGNDIKAIRTYGLQVGFNSTLCQKGD